MALVISHAFNIQNEMKKKNFNTTENKEYQLRSEALI